MRKNTLIFILTTVLVVGLYGFSKKQKKDETKPGSHTMPDHMSKIIKDMDNIMTEMQRHITKAYKKHHPVI